MITVRSLVNVHYYTELPKQCFSCDECFWGTHVYLWRIHFDLWQNQYNIVKLKHKIKFKKRILVLRLLKTNLETSVVCETFYLPIWSGLPFFFTPCPPCMETCSDFPEEIPKIANQHTSNLVFKEISLLIKP